LRLEIPRDRDGSFAPILIPTHECRYTVFDDKFIAMYDRGMTVREIRVFLSDQYGTDGSPDFISSVTDEVMEEIGMWQQRPLEPMCPVIFFNALRVKIREEGLVRNEAIYLARRYARYPGHLDREHRGYKFLDEGVQRPQEMWRRGCTDCCDRWAQRRARAPQCSVSRNDTADLRNILDYAAWDKRRELAKALKPIHRAINTEAARH
jgi:transposase-like protein